MKCETNNGEIERSYGGKYEERAYCPLLCDDVSSEKIMTFRRALIPYTN